MKKNRKRKLNSQRTTRLGMHFLQVDLFVFHFVFVLFALMVANHRLIKMLRKFYGFLKYLFGPTSARYFLVYILGVCSPSLLGPEVL